MSALVGWQPADLRARIAEAMAVYAEAMDFPDRAGARDERTGIVLSHTSRAGFRARAALDDGGALLGFGYGYTGAPGQWWHDQVARGLGSAAGREWLGYAFELCELHVRPLAQGAGLGRRLLVDLLDGAPERTVVLSTPEGGESRAWHLYRSLGFVDLLRDHRFPGDARSFAILGRPLPLDPPVEQQEAARAGA